MTSLFFLLAIVFFLYEFGTIINPYKDVEKINRYGDNEYWKDKDNIKERAKEGCSYMLMHLAYMAWTFIGLAFATQWVSFLILILVGLVAGLVSGLLKRFKLESSRIRIAFKIMDGIICSAIIADIFLVHFQNTPGLVNSVLSWF
jgi:hypothetical protein